MKVLLRKNFVKPLLIIFSLIFLCIILIFVFILFRGLPWFTREPRAVYVKEKCKAEVKKHIGIQESDLKSCYLRDLQVWIICPSEELDKYNQAIEKCLQKYGVKDLDTDAWIGG